jgi:hypothetical protein
MLREKVNVIVTDNGSNIKKAIKNMNSISPNITWQSCTAYTLQLVIGKGLACVKLFVLRAKQLIDFFMRPKQSERLENIQISIQTRNQVVCQTLLVSNITLYKNTNKFLFFLESR